MIFSTLFIDFPLKNFVSREKSFTTITALKNQEIWSIMIQKFEVICTNPVRIGLLQHNEKNTKLEIMVPATK